MNVSAKTEYASIAMVELAARYQSEQPARLRDIATSQGIPQQFLVQIMSQLKAAGLVTSTRGASGGYRLVDHPGNITLADIVSVVEGNGGEATSALARPTPTANALGRVWNEIAESRLTILRQVTLETLAQQVGRTSQEMFYI
ncbi:MAG: Rrf2 family transcriptional regulator [Pirellulaceae bacterium]